MDQKTALPYTGLQGAALQNVGRSDSSEASTRSAAPARVRHGVTRLRGVLGFGTAVLGALVFSVLASATASAAESQEDSGSLFGFLGSTLESVTEPVGGLVGGVLGEVTDLVLPPTPAAPAVPAPDVEPAPPVEAAPVLEAVPTVPPIIEPSPVSGAAATSEPVVAGLVHAATGAVAEVGAIAVTTVTSSPVSGILTPVVTVLDRTVTDLPLLGPMLRPVLGATPLAHVVAPVTGLVDGVLGHTGSVVDAVLVSAIIPTVPGVPGAPPVVVPGTPHHGIPAQGEALVAPPPASPHGGALRSASSAAAGGGAVLSGAPAMSAAGALTAAVSSVIGRILGSKSFEGMALPGGAPSGAAAAALGALAAAFLSRRLLPAPLAGRAAQTSRDDDLPSSPTYSTDSTPD